MIHVPIKWSRTFKKHPTVVFRGVSVFFRGFLLDFVFQEQLQAAMQLSLEASMAAPVPEELGGKPLEVEGPENSLKTKMTLDIFHMFFSRRYIFIWCFFFSIVMLVFRGVVYFSPETLMVGR